MWLVPCLEKMKVKVFLNLVSFPRPHQLCCFTFTISQTSALQGIQLPPPPENGELPLALVYLAHSYSAALGADQGQVEQVLHQLMKEEDNVKRDVVEEERGRGRLQVSSSYQPLLPPSSTRTGAPLPPAPLVSTSLDWVRGGEVGYGWTAPSSPHDCPAPSPSSSSSKSSKSNSNSFDTSPTCTWRCGARGGGKSGKEVSGLAAIIASLTLRWEEKIFSGFL